MKYDSSYAVSKDLYTYLYEKAYNIPSTYLSEVGLTNYILLRYSSNKPTTIVKEQLSIGWNSHIKRRIERFTLNNVHIVTIRCI